MTKPACIIEGERPAGCDGAGQLFLRLDSGEQRVVPVQMWSEGTNGLVSLKPSKIIEGNAWSEVRYKDGAFWVRTKPSDVQPYEKQASYVQDLSTWCSAPGNCAPAKPQWAKAIEEVSKLASNPAGAAYLIEERVKFRGVSSDFAPRYPVLQGGEERSRPRSGRSLLG